MMLEALTIFSCINNSGCETTAQAYYASHPSLKELVDNVEVQVREVAGSYVVEYAAPVLATAAGKDVVIKLNRNFSIKLNENKLIYNKEF